MNKHLMQAGISRREYKQLVKQGQRIAFDNYKDEPSYKSAQRWDLFFSLVFALLAAFTIRQFFFEPVRVVGPSMQPTLYTDERMIVEKVSYGFTEPKRGEIVIVRYPLYTESCVKRVIGLPGETVEVRDGKIYINGGLLDESAYWNDMIYDDVEPRRIGANCIFVVGDNRNMSSDSRDESVGSIPYARIIGRVRGVMWPLSKATIY